MQTRPQEEFRAFFRVMHRFGRLTAGAIPMGGLTKGEFFCMGAICGFGQEKPERDGIYVWELAKHTHAHTPAVSRILRDLEARGYIDRIVDREDRRNVMVRPTADGLAVWAQAEAWAGEFLGRVLEQMGEADMVQLVTLCARLCDVIEEEQDKSGKGEMA